MQQGRRAWRRAAAALIRWRRSPREIAFRLKQETRNLALFLRPPRLIEAAAAGLPLPDPHRVAERLRRTSAADDIDVWAAQILDHRFPLLGLEIDTGPEIHWRRDYQSGKETAPIYFRRIPYLDAARSGDHKIIWELNRHQHLVLLAQAYVLTERVDFLAEIERQLASWFPANSFQCGVNWTSALEVAFRALSWLWVDHLVGDRMAPALQRQFRQELYRHGFHLEHNLSVYFSPNTHLLGEAVALHALGLFFRGTKQAEEWELIGARVAAAQMDAQVRADGSHFEQSSYYHVYALDMFLFHAVLAPTSPHYHAKLALMAEYLEALLGPGRRLPAIGDDDGGRFFSPFGARDRFGRATLATCGVLLHRPEWIVDGNDLFDQAAWWLGPHALDEPGRLSAPQSRWFPGAGTAVMVSGDRQVLADAGPFGPFRSGHSHADTLSIVARAGDQDLLIDPGTFTYVGDARWRDMFRGTAAHNTIRVEELDQAEPSGPFGWRNPPRVDVRHWHSEVDADFLDAECRYRGFRHRRRVLFVKPKLLFILDNIQNESQRTAWTAEQFWHAGGALETLAPDCFRIAGEGMLTLALSGAPVDLLESGELGWRSPIFGVKQPAPVLVVRKRSTGALRFGALFAFSDSRAPASLAIVPGEAGARLVVTGAWNVGVEFPESGTPRVESSVNGVE